MLRDGNSTLIMSPTSTSLPVSWPAEFAEVVLCKKCQQAECPKLLRDEQENIPQPGYVGPNYHAVRLLLVGQNPGVDTVGLSDKDRVYTRALRDVGRAPSATTFDSLLSVMMDFVPSWPVHGRYFPLAECRLGLKDIAYCNAVRCRTVGNTTPSKTLARNCVDSHFKRWLDILQPRVVVFIGKWAHEQCHLITDAREIPSAYMNRQRSLSSEGRARNRGEVIMLVNRTVSPQL